MSIVTTTGSFCGGGGVADRHVQVDRVQLHRNRDDQHDDQHQHHVDQRRGVDVHHHLGLAARCWSLRSWPWWLLQPFGRRFGDEADLLDRSPLCTGTGPGRPTRSAPARRRGCAPRAAASCAAILLQALEQRVGVGHQALVPEDVAVLVDGDVDVLRLGLATAMLVSFGSDTWIVCVTTGIVIRKMISSTSITSTSGVVLIVGDDLVLVAVGAYVHRHGGSPLGRLQRAAGARRCGHPSARRAGRRRSGAPTPSSPCCGGPASCSRAPPARRPHRPMAVMISASPTGPATLSIDAWPAMPIAVSAL